MTFRRAVLAGFIGGLVAAVLMLAWRSSKEHGKGLQESFVDVPSEAQRLAAEAGSRVVEAVVRRWGAVR